MMAGRGTDRRAGKARGAAQSLVAFALALALSLIAFPTAQAQQKVAPVPPRSEPATPAPLDAPPPYERQLLRLSEILGALAWLTELCGETDGGAWRVCMSALLEVEGATQARRERLAGAYNRGFRGYGALHRRCTPNAELIIARFLEEGSRIARDVATRYSG